MYIQIWQDSANQNAFGYVGSVKDQAKTIEIENNKGRLVEFEGIIMISLTNTGLARNHTSFIVIFWKIQRIRVKSYDTLE